ncbi:uncharacterized protein [Scyliorhinus torazame]|uniref:uncharacterized protein n=1 Tax=Scyliorhinus torazame TaxID=75743 RepID=UPI003B58F3C7
MQDILKQRFSEASTPGCVKKWDRSLGLCCIINRSRVKDCFLRLEDCLCWSPNRTGSCSSRGLESLPRGIPAGTRALDLSDNRLEWLDWGPGRGLSRRLEELELSHNRLRELEAGALGGLERLQRLGLGHNLLRYLQPGTLRGLAALRSLELAGNPLLLLGDHTFRGLAALRTLSLGSPELAWAGPRAWAGLSGLNQLTVRGAALTWPPGPALSPLLNLTALRLLAFPKAAALPGRPFQDLSRLRLLEIDSWASLAQLGPDCLQGLNLVWLSITHCNLSTVPHASLRTQAYLRFLNLSYNPISAIRGALLQHVTRLEELRLVGGRLRIIHDAAFRGLVYFRLLDVTANQLASLPAAAFRSLASLQSLGLGLNPLACDCRLLWIVRHRLRFLGPQPPTCASPPSLHGRRLPEAAGSLPASTFSCRRPRIHDKRPQRLQAREGQTVTLRCSADGQPPPLILWLNPRRQRLGHPEAGMSLPGAGMSLPGGLGLVSENLGLNPEDRGLLPGRPDPSLPPAPPLLSGPAVGCSRLLPDGSLQITSVRRMDSGTYRCVARKAGGNDTARPRYRPSSISIGTETRIINSTQNHTGISENWEIFRGQLTPTSGEIHQPPNVSNRLIGLMKAQCLIWEKVNQRTEIIQSKKRSKIMSQSVTGDQSVSSYH